jgi:hypothetical protein
VPVRPLAHVPQKAVKPRATPPHDHRKTYVSAVCGVRGFVFRPTRYRKPGSEDLTGDSPSPFDVDVANNVIKFPVGVSRRAHARKRRAVSATELDDRPKVGSATAENGRVHKGRREVWRERPRQRRVIGGCA